MKRRCQRIKRVKERANLEWTWQAGMNFSSRISSRGPSGNVGSSIQVKYKWMRSHTFFKAMIFCAKLNLGWAKLLFLWFPFWINWLLEKMVNMINIAALWLATQGNLPIKSTKTLGDSGDISMSQSWGLAVTLVECPCNKMKRSWRIRKRVPTLSSQLLEGWLI